MQLKKNDLKKAGNLLKEAGHKKKATELLSKLKRIEDNRHKDLISFEEYNRQINIITDALLNYIEAPFSEEIQQPNIINRFKPYYIWVISVFILILTAWFIFNQFSSKPANDEIFGATNLNQRQIDVLNQTSSVVGLILASDEQEKEAFKKHAEEFKKIYYSEIPALNDSILQGKLLHFKRSLDDYSDEFISQNQLKAIGLDLVKHLRTLAESEKN